MENTTILYKKNRHFAIRRLQVPKTELDAVLARIPRGEYFNDVILEPGECIDIIDIKYLVDDETVQLLIHFAIIGQD